MTILSIDDIVADGKSLVTGGEPQFKAVAPDEGVATSETADSVAPVEETPVEETEE